MRESLVFAALFLTACGSAPAPEPQRAESPKPSPAPKPADNRPVLLCFGDSLTAGYGVPPGADYPSLLQQALDEKGYRYRVVNQGVSGDTTSGGLARLPQALALKPEIVLLELGANDGLRGLPIELTRANLGELIEALQKSGARVLLAAMTLPRNYGPDYIAQFEALYPALARKYKLTLVPFRLEPLLARPGLLQPDGLHPTAEGYRQSLPAILNAIEPALRR